MKIEKFSVHDAMKGSHKLAKVAGGVCHFAEVEVEIESVESEGVMAVDASTVSSMGSYWIPAAIEGAGCALASVGEGRYRLRRIGKLEGTFADTSADSVWVAAVLATLKAMGMEHEIQGISFRGPHWVVELGGELKLSPGSGLRR